jgi:flavin-dependent dehydrogenase
VAGVAGLTLAVALKQALGEGFRVIVADPALAGPPRADDRAYAVAAAARNMLDALGIWRLAEAAATPMTEMIITDSRTPDLVRPVFLTFDGEIEPGQPFAHMVENGALVTALLQVARANGVELRAEGVHSPHRRRRLDRDRLHRRRKARCGAAGRGRWRPLATARTGRYRLGRLVLSAIRDCRDDRP